MSMSKNTSKKEHIPIKLKERYISGKITSVTIPKTITLTGLKKLAKETFKLTTTVDLYLEIDKGKNFLPLTKTIQPIIEEYQKTKEPPLVIVRYHIKLKELQQLRKVIQKKAFLPYSALVAENLPVEKTLDRIIHVTQQFLHEILLDPKKVSYKIPSRSNDNIGYDDNSKMVLLGHQLSERQFRNLSSVQSVQQLTGLMRYIYEILTEGIHVTKRDLFYRDVNLFGKQQISDALIEDLGVMLGVTRNSLNVIAAAKGKVIGRLQFTEKGDLIDATKGIGGHAITPMQDQVENLESDAEFVLVIEKDAVFQRLAEDRFFNYVPAILVTASGQPDMATRVFVKRLREELELPILGFMDADPYGLDILRVYTIGSKSLSFETSGLAVPDFKWLGLFPSDIDTYKLPKEALIEMSPRDIKRAEDLLQEDFVKARPAWKHEIELMLEKGKKAEIQALASKNLRFMTDYYLPHKIDSGDWV